MGTRVAVLMGPIQKHVGDLFRYGLIDAQHNLQGDILCVELF